MRTRDVKQRIIANAEEIRQLHARIRQTLRRRDESLENRQQWVEACREFRANYNWLAFPGGYWTDSKHNALARIVSGDSQAMEAAICFLEIRPYFFRSGYMFKDILRKAKKTPLSAAQSARLQKVLQSVEEWRRSKQKT